AAELDTALDKRDLVIEISLVGLDDGPMETVHHTEKRLVALALQQEAGFLADGQRGHPECGPSAYLNRQARLVFRRRRRRRWRLEGDADVGQTLGACQTFIDLHHRDPVFDLLRRPRIGRGTDVLLLDGCHLAQHDAVAELDANWTGNLPRVAVGPSGQGA